MKLGSTRQAIHDALAYGLLRKQSNIVEFTTYLCKIDKGGVARDNCVDSLEVGWILAAISKLPPHIQGWIRFAYGPEDSPIIQKGISTYLRHHIWPVLSIKKHQRILALCHISVEDYRLRLWQNKNMPVVAYCHEMGVNERNFRRDWGDSLDRCLDLLKLMDSDGVGRVSAMVKALRGQAEDEQGNPIGPSKILDK